MDKLPEPALEAAERMLKNYQSWPPKPPMTVERMRRRVELEERLGLSDDGKLLRYSQQIGGPDGKTNHYEVASRYLKEILRSTVASPPQRFSIAVGKSACRYQSDGRIDSLRLARRSAAVRQSYAMYALDAKAAIFRSERRLLPALAAILIPASVLSNKSAMLSRLASDLISLWFFAAVSTRIRA